MEDFILTEPAPEMEKQVMDYRKAYFDAGETHINGSASLHRYENFAEWLARVQALKTLPTGPYSSPATTFLAINQSGEVVGTIQVRHFLNEDLEKSGGNIGFGVSPKQRGKGYATAMLNKALEFCRLLRLEKVLLDCEVGNIASEKTILRMGGVFKGEKTEIDENGQPEHLRQFWIYLS